MKYEKVKMICIVCEKKYEIHQCDFKRGFRKSCSMKCASIAKRKYPLDKKRCTKCKEILSSTLENFYKNNSKSDYLTTECKKCVAQVNHEKRHRRKDFISERNKKCQKCGIENDEPMFFDVDHINPLFEMSEKRKQYDFSKKENLQVLCPNCHRKKTIKEWKYIHKSRRKYETKDIVI